MGSRKTRMEILFIILAGLVPIGLAIHNVLKAEKSESDLKNRQIQLIATQNSLIQKQDDLNHQQGKYSEEIKEKTDKVIELQDQLAQKSTDQIEKLERLANPISREASINFTSTIITSEEEYADLLTDLNTSGVKTGNLLPTTFVTSKPIIQKINQFKDIFCRILIVLNNEKNKKITLRRDIVPTFLGYNTANSKDCFVLSYGEHYGSSIRLISISLLTDVDFDYDQGSLLDFKNSTADISFDFSVPITLQVGSQNGKKYIHDRDFIQLTLNSLTINFKGYKSIELKDFTKKGKNKFQARLNSSDI